MIAIKANYKGKRRGYEIEQYQGEVYSLLAHHGWVVLDDPLRAIGQIVVGGIFLQGTKPAVKVALLEWLVNYARAGRIA